LKKNTFTRFASTTVKEEIAVRSRSRSEKGKIEIKARDAKLKVNERYNTLTSKEKQKVNEIERNRHTEYYLSPKVSIR
jgi:predicted nucleic acid-binding protein